MYTKKFTNAESSTRGFEWQKKTIQIHEQTLAVLTPSSNQTYYSTHFSCCLFCCQMTRRLAFHLFPHFIAYLLTDLSSDFLCGSLCHAFLSSISGDIFDPLFS